MSDNWSVPPTSSLPQPPSPPPPDRRRFHAIVGAAVAVALAVVVGLTVGLLRDDSGPVLVGEEAAPPSPAGEAGTSDEDQPDSDPVPEPSDDGSSDDGTGASTTTEPDVEESAAELDALLPTLMAFVEQERGLEFKEDPEVVVLDDDAFVERFNELLAEDFSENADEWARFTGIFQALAILNDGVTLEQANRAFGEAGVLGYYDPETDELVVRGGDITPLVRIVILHELVHALDDQWFDLDRPEYDDRADEIGFGFSAVIEGNARFIEGRYRDTLSSAEREAAAAEERGLGDGVDFSALTLPFLELQFAPYEYGELLVEELWEQGQPTLDAAFEAPPDTSEQVIITGAYRAGETRIDVAAPPADGEVIEDGVFGQLILQVLLATSVGEDAGADAAAGWAGDWFVAWAAGDETCVRADVMMDDEGQRDELAAAVSAWADDQSDASSEITPEGNVRFTACG